jgi:GTP-binding protein HflX
MTAFRATLEELEDTDLLLHLIDASSPRFEQQTASVENILSELQLNEKPRLLVFNKIDKISREETDNLAARYNAVAVSALDPSTFGPLLKAIEERIWTGKLVEAKG